MNEKLLQHIWQLKLFDVLDLKDVFGNPVTVIKNGDLNTNAGPDFTNAQIKIGNTIWAGNIEIHVKSADFFSHKHQHDRNYDNLILHVVWEHNSTIPVNAIATVELKNYVNNEIVKRYNQLSLSAQAIPCKDLIKDVEEIVGQNWLNRLLIERIETKTRLIETELEKNNHNWEETFYQQLSARLATSINAAAFEQLAKKTPLSVIVKVKNNLTQLEALLFGQAGLLEESTEEPYYNLLQKEYAYIKQAYRLTNLEPEQFKFLRLRPSNFPTVRLAQLAMILHNNNGLFSKLVNAAEIETIYSIFNVNASDYWTQHYVFGKPSVQKIKRIGKSTINGIIINTIVPFMFLYTRLQNNEELQEKALDWMYLLQFEENVKIKKFRSLLNYKPAAASSQALIQLYDNYCSKKRCLNCAIGIKILKNQ